MNIKITTAVSNQLQVIEIMPILTGLFRSLVDEADSKIWSDEKIQFFELAYTDSINFCGTDWLLCCLIVLESQFHYVYNTDVLG